MTNLSPAAQAVLAAVASQMEGGWISPDFIPYEAKKIAAALRAAAECSCEEQDTPPETLYEHGYLDALERVFKRMNAIAAELEALPE